MLFFNRTLPCQGGKYIPLINRMDEVARQIDAVALPRSALDTFSTALFSFYVGSVADVGASRSSDVPPKAARANSNSRQGGGFGPRLDLESG